MLKRCNQKSGNAAILLALGVATASAIIGGGALLLLNAKERETIRNERKRIANDSAAYSTEYTAKKISSFSLIRNSVGQWTNSGDVLFGDGNSDGLVDGADYTLWADNFLKENVVGGPRVGDFNRDGKVNGSDYTVWADNFLHQKATDFKPHQEGTSGEVISPTFCDPRFLSPDTIKLMFEKNGKHYREVLKTCKKAPNTSLIDENALSGRTKITSVGETANANESGPSYNLQTPGQNYSYSNLALRKVSSLISALVSTPCREYVSDEPLRRVYRTFLGREPRAEELKSADTGSAALALGENSAGEEVDILKLAQALLNSQELANKGGDEFIIAVGIFRTITGMLPDSNDSEFNDWVTQLKAGTPVTQIAMDAHGHPNAKGSGQKNQVVDSFRKILGRSPDDVTPLASCANRTEQQCWVRKLEFGQATILSMEAELRGDDANDEYSKNGGANGEKVIALFETILGRPPRLLGNSGSPSNMLEDFYPIVMSLENVRATARWVSQSIRGTLPTATEFMDQQGCPILPPAPQCSLTAFPEEIDLNERANFDLIPYGAITSYTWTGPNWNTSVNNPSSNEALPTQRSFTPVVQPLGDELNSTATISGPGGSTTCSVKVKVNPPVIPPVVVNPPVVPPVAPSQITVYWEDKNGQNSDCSGANKDDKLCLRGPYSFDPNSRKITVLGPGSFSAYVKKRDLRNPANAHCASDLFFEVWRGGNRIYQKKYVPDHTPQTYVENPPTQVGDEIRLSRRGREAYCSPTNGYTDQHTRKNSGIPVSCPNIRVNESCSINTIESWQSP